MSLFLMKLVSISWNHSGFTKGYPFEQQWFFWLAMNWISAIKIFWNDASYPTDSLEYERAKAEITNPNTNIHFRLEQSSTMNISFMDENQDKSESTSFLTKLKATPITNINRLMIEMLSDSIKAN